MPTPPRAYATKITPDMAVNPDPMRDVVTITNETGRTIFVGYDSTLSIANGTHIYNHGRFSASKETGFDPKIAYYLIDTIADGDVRIIEGRVS